ncbi:LRC8A-like protein, partial [Mya arenaria]
MCNVFNGYELLLFKRFNEKPEEWLEWKNKLKEREEKGDTASFDIPQELWYLYVALHQRPRYLMQLIFKCANIRYLSLKYNCLYDIPPDIGFLQKLEYLALTNNRLHVQSIPYTLTFCRNLRTLLLDNNLLDALPGFLLQMQSLETVHRHGNHNYFKSTFMWYHTDIYCRIMEMNGTGVMSTKRPMSLSFWAAKALVGSKKNFFTDENVAPVLKDYLCGVYDMFNNPYLGNTCVPFQHWVCSVKCAQALEVPARLEQIAKAHKLDTQYERYVLNCQKEFFKCRHKHPLLACVVKVDGDLEEDSDCYSD